MEQPFEFTEFRPCPMKKSVLQSRLAAELMGGEPYDGWNPDMVLGIETEQMIEILKRRELWATFARKYRWR